jgi:hypothetical protein
MVQDADSSAHRGKAALALLQTGWSKERQIPFENRSGVCLIVSRAMAKILPLSYSGFARIRIKLGSVANEIAAERSQVMHLLWAGKTKAASATKKNPRQSTHLGFLSRCLTYLGFWIGRQGCRGMGLPPNRPNAIQLGLLPLGYKLHLGNAAI